jgi:hypothetical protein
MISTFTAFFDSNVFFGARLRSLMLWLAQTGLFRARWSEDVHREWMEAVVKKRPGISADNLRATRDAMDGAVLDCLVTGYAGLIESLSLPDAGDRHMLAAAIVCRASVIVTFNENDFPESALDPYGIHIRRPDDFILDVYGIDAAAFVEAVRQDLRHYRRPQISFDEYVCALAAAAGAPQTADRLSQFRIPIE